MKNKILENFRKGLRLNLDLDNYALNFLSPILGEMTIPICITSSALRPFCLLHILNEITINGRKHLLELGGGISTLIIAKYIKKYKLNCKYTCIEQSSDWIEHLKAELTKEGLSGVVSFVHAPLENKDNEIWYNRANVKKWLNSTDSIDCLVIDGPTAYTNQTESSRKGAIFHLHPYLDENFFVLLDDIAREKEEEFVQIWSDKYDIKMNMMSNIYAYGTNGFSYNSFPSKL